MTGYMRNNGEDKHNHPHNDDEDPIMRYEDEDEDDDHSLEGSSLLMPTAMNSLQNSGMGRAPRHPSVVQQQQQQQQQQQSSGSMSGSNFSSSGILSPHLLPPPPPPPPPNRSQPRQSGSSGSAGNHLAPSHRSSSNSSLSSNNSSASYPLIGVGIGRGSDRGGLEGVTGRHSSVAAASRMAVTNLKSGAQYFSSSSDEEFLTDEEDEGEEGLEVASAGVASSRCHTDLDSIIEHYNEINLITNDKSNNEHMMHQYEENESELSKRGGCGDGDTGFVDKEIGEPSVTPTSFTLSGPLDTLSGAPTIDVDSLLAEAEEPLLSDCEVDDSPVDLVENQRSSLTSEGVSFNKFGQLSSTDISSRDDADKEKNTRSVLEEILAEKDIDDDDSSSMSAKSFNLPALLPHPIRAELVDFNNSTNAMISPHDDDDDANLEDICDDDFSGKLADASVSIDHTCVSCNSETDKKDVSDKSAVVIEKCENFGNVQIEHSNGVSLPPTSSEGAEGESIGDESSGSELEHHSFSSNSDNDVDGNAREEDEDLNLHNKECDRIQRSPDDFDGASINSIDSPRQVSLMAEEESIFDPSFTTSTNVEIEIGSDNQTILVHEENVAIAEETLKDSEGENIEGNDDLSRKEEESAIVIDVEKVRDFFVTPNLARDDKWRQENSSDEKEAETLSSLNERKFDTSAPKDVENLEFNRDQEIPFGPPKMNILPTVKRSATNGTRPRSVEDLSSGILPEALMMVRQKIESLSLFDSDMMRLAQGDNIDYGDDEDEDVKASQESLKRSFQNAISAAILVSLAHKRYERRRLAAMEIEKIVRSLVSQNDFERVRAIILLLSDDYVRSSNEDARKGGVVALAASAIGLKKGNEEDASLMECKDLILASVVHCCQDHSQRVRYYATESLFNVVKVIPSLAVQHFFILFEILRSLYADVDHDVRSGAQLLDKKLKEIIVVATNNGSFSFDKCVPLFTRFIHMTNKPTKRLTLSWLQAFAEKVLGSPILEWIHLFLMGVFEMLADATSVIRKLALEFLETALPRLEVNMDQDFEVTNMSSVVDFDKVIQVLVQTMEHPDPLVRKVAMYWISRIVKAHIEMSNDQPNDEANCDGLKLKKNSTASVAVRNSLPHMLPGVLLSIGDAHDEGCSEKGFLPHHTTRSLAEQTNICLQNAIKEDGKAYVDHLDGLTLALREELDSPGGCCGENALAFERKPHRVDVNPDGTGIESAGWFRSNESESFKDRGIPSRLCALQWVMVIYEYVTPDNMKANYTRRFINPIVQNLVSRPPDTVIFKSFEVLAHISVLKVDEKGMHTPEEEAKDETDDSIHLALQVIDPSQRSRQSRDREVFFSLIKLYSFHSHLLIDFPKVIRHMCTLQPPQFVFLSFATELDRFIWMSERSAKDIEAFNRDLDFTSKFIQQLNHVMLTSVETLSVRDALLNCVGVKEREERDDRKINFFGIILKSFSHNLVATITLCLWAGAFQTASIMLSSINRMDINLNFLMEIDILVELLERPLFRHLHFQMLELDDGFSSEGNGSMLFRALKSILMLLPQSRTYSKLKTRLLTVASFRKSIHKTHQGKIEQRVESITKKFVERILCIRQTHNDAKWKLLRSESLEPKVPADTSTSIDLESSRRNWVGYANEDEENQMRDKIQTMKKKALTININSTTSENLTAELNSLPALPEGADSWDGKTDKPLLRHPNDVPLSFTKNDDDSQGIENKASKTVAFGPKKISNDIEANKWKQIWTQGS